MAKIVKSQQSYQDLYNELTTVLGKLSEDELAVDEALVYYKRGLELTEQLKKYLATAANEVTKLEALSTDV